MQGNRSRATRWRDRSISLACGRSGAAKKSVRRPRPRGGDPLIRRANPGACATAVSASPVAEAERAKKSVRRPRPRGADPLIRRANPGARATAASASTVPEAERAAADFRLPLPRAVARDANRSAHLAAEREERASDQLDLGEKLVDFFGQLARIAAVAAPCVFRFAGQLLPQLLLFAAAEPGDLLKE